MRDYDLVPGYPATGTVIATPGDVPSSSALRMRRWNLRKGERRNEEVRRRYKALRLAGMPAQEARVKARRSQ